MISTTERNLLLDGVEVSDSGVGPVVALAHGAGGGVRENFSALMETMTERRFVGPYYPGAGKTAPHQDPLSIDTLADTVVAAALRTGAQRFPIVGLSLGAAVAVTAAARHPEHVSALVLTVGLAHPDAQSRALTSVWQHLAAAGEFDTLAELILSGANSPATLEKLSAEDYRATVREIRRGYPLGGAAHVELVRRTDVRPLLAGISAPTLVVVSGQDRMVLPATARAFATAVPNAELVEYPDAGHIFTADEARRWSVDVAAFLDRWVS